MLERYKTAACSSEAISLSIRYGILLALNCSYVRMEDFGCAVDSQGIVVQARKSD